ncbi:MAG: hypothetical protein VX347_03925 [Bacteroidota bacterium]|nr:hypothetical protein [Bacteroidota bacterium]
MDKKLSFFWSILTILIFITLHLKVFSLPFNLNFDVALSFLLIPLWVFFTFNIRLFSFKRAELYLLIFFLILPIINIHLNNWSEFFKSYGQYAISYYLVSRVVKKIPRIQGFTVNRTIFAFQIFLVFVTIGQFILVNVFGFDARNVFGELQLYYQQHELISGIQRMKAFYLEPSYLGFVAINIFWARYYLDRRKSMFGFNFLGTLIILILANSAFGFLAITCIILFELSRSIKQYPVILGLSIFVIASSLVYYFQEDLISFFRLNELDPNSQRISSGLFRVLLPIEAIYQMFQDGYIFGLSFGQFEQYIESMMIFNGHAETSISNSFFLLIGYFGVTAILIYSIMLFIFLKSKNRILKSFILLSIINLNNSGAFITLQYVFVAILIPILIISLYERDINNYSST